MRLSPLVVAALVTSAALAGCLSGGDGEARFAARPIASDSTASFTIDRAAGLTYADVLIIADDRPFRFGPRADLAEGWYGVEGKDDPNAPVEIGDEIRLPAAGKVDVEFRRAADGATLAQYALDVPDATPPPPPAGLAPAQGARDVERDVHFEWETVADPAGVSYQVEWWPKVGGSANAPPKTVTGIAGNAYTVPASDGLLPAQTYEWHVRAVDGRGNAGPWSAVREFTTGF